VDFSPQQLQMLLTIRSQVDLGQHVPPLLIFSVLTEYLLIMAVAQ
jgi:hypothetical protein